MPTYNNITVTPGSGTGTKSLTISATTNTGRNNRSAVVSASGTGKYSSVSSSNSLTITQQGKAGFLSVSTNSSTTGFPAEGGNITFAGKSNLATITLGSGNLDNLLSSATINGVSVTKAKLQSGYTLPNDPGATAEYVVSFTFTIPANESISSTVTYAGTVGGQALSVRQLSASASLNFSSATATINSDGTLISPASVSVEASNGLGWQITVTES